MPASKCRHNHSRSDYGMWRIFLPVLAPIGHEAPTQPVKRDLASRMIAPDYKQVLARRAVPTRRIVVHAAVADIHPGDDTAAQRSAALNDPPAHAQSDEDCSVQITGISVCHICSGVRRVLPDGAHDSHGSGSP